MKTTKQILRKLFMIAITIVFSISITSCGKIEKANNESDVRSLEDFENAKIGVKVGSVQDTLVGELLPNATRVYFERDSDTCLALEKGKIDGMVVNTASGTALSAAYNNITRIKDSLKVRPIAAVFPKNKKSDALRAEYDEYIESLRASGELDELFNTWISKDYPNLPIPELPTDDGKRKPLNIATDACQEPYVFYKDNKLSGFDVALIKGFCEKYNYYPIYHDMNFESIIMGISTDSYDMASAFFAVTEERAKQVNFSVDVGMIGSSVFYIDKSSQKNGMKNGIIDRIKSTFVVEERWRLILDGILTTIIITLLSAIIGTLLSYLICRILQLNKKVPSMIARGFIKLFQGTPIVVVLMVFYYIIFGHSSIPNIIVAAFAFSCNLGAYGANIMYQGVLSIDKGQREAALTLGFTENETFHRFILPQAIEQFAPVYIGELITLLKGTSVVGYIAIQDLTKMGDIIRSRTYDAFVPLITVAVIYYLLALLITKLLSKLVKKIIPERKARKPKGVKIND